MSHSVKIYDTCIGCTQCVRDCPTDLLEMISCRATDLPVDLPAVKALNSSKSNYYRRFYVFNDKFADSKSDDNCALSDSKRVDAAATNAVASTAVYIASTSQLWCSSSDMTTGKGVADQPSGRGRGRGRGRISAGILENSGSSPSNPTILVMSQVADASEQLFIMVSNPNYVPTSSTTLLPPSAQKPTISEMPPPATNTVAPKLSHGSQPADAPLPPPIVRMMIWLMVEWRKFVPNNNTCTQKMTNVIKLIYDNPWLRYKKIPSETRER
ncbi:hypothetical protein Ahy_B09g097976 [Arachis hypogaea]|uniref:4Fe-4S ferredoxin-type domain-containing protein n=1 Tax=Arachis hypogaea TaxID=3818 RepID=A0A444XQA5_ARAHY|nr:hypothetical protein Ahy_B09g097976 [Arachis hypogaea]